MEKIDYDLLASKIAEKMKSKDTCPMMSEKEDEEDDDMGESMLGAKKESGNGKRKMSDKERSALSIMFLMKPKKKE